MASQAMTSLTQTWHDLAFAQKTLAAKHFAARNRADQPQLDRPTEIHDMFITLLRSTLVLFLSLVSFALLANIYQTYVGHTHSIIKPSTIVGVSLVNGLLFAAWTLSLVLRSTHAIHYATAACVGLFLTAVLGYFMPEVFVDPAYAESLFIDWKKAFVWFGLFLGLAVLTSFVQRRAQ